MKSIDIEHAKYILNYNPETGLFTRKVITTNSVKVGDIAGFKRPDGYISIKLKGVPIQAHRIAWAMFYGFNPIELDHINGIKNDNRISNLRECTISENNSNKPRNKNNKSGVKGVNWINEQCKWRARIKKDNKQIHLGYYINIDDAVKAYQDAAIKYHGEFAKF